MDRVGVYLNGYPDIPDFLNHPKVSVARSQDLGDIGDAGKFHWVDKVHGYYLTCDDDLIYPLDYVQVLLSILKDNKNKVVVGVHGAILREPITSYYHSRRVFHFSRALAQAIQVHVLGTGTVAFHTSAIRVTPADFPYPNMADVWLAIQGQKQGVPFLCVPRKNAWLKDSNAPESIFNNSMKKSGTRLDTATKQTQVVLENGPWRMPSLGTQKAVFLVPTTNRPVLLRVCLQSLQQQISVPGWQYDIRVAGSSKDPGKATALEMGVQYIDTPVLYPGLKLNAAAEAGEADLYMAADDDDIQSPNRLTESIKAFEAGHGWSSTSGIHYADIQTGRFAFWKGSAALVGTTTSLSAKVFRQVGGWPGVSRGKESLLQQRLTALNITCYDIGASLKDTLCLQHSTNIWAVRPFPNPDTQVLQGQFLVTGLQDSDVPSQMKLAVSDLRRRLNGED